MAKLIMTVAEKADEKKWLEVRREGIGCSDASIIVGLNRWKSPFQLWLEKTGKAEPEDLSDNEYVYWGKVLEEAVANRFCELTGKKVQRRGLLQMDDTPTSSQASTAWSSARTQDWNARPATASRQRNGRMTKCPPPTTCNASTT